MKPRNASFRHQKHNDINSNRNEASSGENPTTLFTLNDISRGDRHVQRNVRKMLRNVNLARKRSASCASLTSVKE